MRVDEIIRSVRDGKLNSQDSEEKERKGKETAWNGRDRKGKEGKETEWNRRNDSERTLRRTWGIEAKELGRDEEEGGRQSCVGLTEAASDHCMGFNNCMVVFGSFYIGRVGSSHRTSRLYPNTSHSRSSAAADNSSLPSLGVETKN